MAEKFVNDAGLQYLLEYLLQKINDKATTVLDNLNSTSSTSALSANMGRVLDNKIGDISTILASVVEG